MKTLLDESRSMLKLFITQKILDDQTKIELNFFYRILITSISHDFTKLMTSY